MKIIEIQGYPYNDDDIRVSVTVMMPGASVIDAMVSVAALFAGKVESPNASVSEQTVDPSPSMEIAESALVHVGPETVNIPEPSRRRRRTAAEMAADAQEKIVNPSVSDAPLEGSRRRRLSPPAPDPMPINDAEMSKAASNAAEELVKLGEDGPALVQLIIGDYDVKFVGEIPVEKRIEFIEKLQTEVRLAKEEKGAA